MFQVSLICAQIVIELEHILSCNVIDIYYMPLLPVSATSIYIYIYIDISSELEVCPSHAIHSTLQLLTVSKAIF